MKIGLTNRKKRLRNLSKKEAQRGQKPTNCHIMKVFIVFFLGKMIHISAKSITFATEKIE